MRAQISATPRFIQYCCVFDDGTSIVKTKFVECPVVDNVPARVNVLYTGHIYIPDVGVFRFCSGCNHIIGISVNNSFGRDSPSTCNA